MIGTRFGHSRITRKAAEGGKGVANKRKDARLGLYLVSKFLLEAMAPGRQVRDPLQRDARAATVPGFPDIWTVQETSSYARAALIASKDSLASTLGLPCILACCPSKLAGRINLAR